MDSSSTSLDAARELLGKTLRVTLTDGRVYEGLFTCLDKSFNVVLNGACELTPLGRKPPLNPRVGGVVIVPGAHIVRCEA